MKSAQMKPFHSSNRKFCGVLKLLAVAVTAAFTFSAQAATKKIGNYTWTYTAVKGGVQIGDGTGVAVSPAPTGVLTVPAKIGKYAVKAIGAKAFYECEDLIAVKVPNGVTSIGAYSFVRCYNLAGVSLPKTVKSIGTQAFWDCRKLAGLTLPTSVRSIGDYAFAYCYSLQKASIPKGVTKIGDGTYTYCTNLVRLTLPTTVTSIGMGAFNSCKSLKNISIPSSVKTIGDYAFQKSGLTALSIPGNVKTIGNYAFDGCAALKAVLMLSGLTSLGKYAFSDCPELGPISLPHSLTEIGDLVFYRSFPASGTRTIYYEYGGDETTDSDEVRFKGLLGNCGVDVSTLTFVLRCKLTLKPNNKKYGTAVIDEGDLQSASSWCRAESLQCIIAKPKKGSAFAGWFTDKACKKALNPAGYDNRSPTVVVKMPRKHTTIYAKFITKAAAKKTLKFTSATKKLAKTATAGSPEKSVAIKVAASSATLMTLSAKGLPKGMSFDAATGTIAGKPTVPGTHSITIAAKDAAGNKISQKVKISAEVMTWSRGTYYGRAMVDSGNVPAIAQCTVAKTGKVSGKITYKGKAYSFTSKCSSSTVDATTFSIKVKIGSKTFSTGTVTTFKAGTEFKVVCAESANRVSFIVQKSPGLLKAGGALEKYIGKIFTVSGNVEGSELWGLKKSTDKLTFKILKGDLVQFSGTVNGAKISATTAPLRLIYNTLDRSADAGVEKEIDEGVEYTTYKLYADLVALKGKYFHPLMIEVMVDSAGTIQRESWQ